MENIFKNNPEKPSERQEGRINFEELREKRNQIYKNSDSYKSMTEFVEKLQAKYPDYQNYKIYHFLIGSTFPGGAELNEEDFPGEDSIANFLNKLFV